MLQTDSLTIVIPYYKKLFLDRTLTSLVAQTSKGFCLLIGDDSSPDNPDDVLLKYKEHLDISYVRFPLNLGKQSVVSHWNRCIAMTNTTWVWLFSDDDTASPDCVEVFYEHIRTSTPRKDVYRFNTVVIDANGAIVRKSPSNPPDESASALALCRLVGWREFFIQNHIFTRAAFDREGGLVKLPTGLFSEDASFSKLAGRTGVQTIPKGTVFWRESSLNLNASRPDLVDAKYAAFMGYIAWVGNQFKCEPPAYHLELRRGAVIWIKNAIRHLGGIPSLAVKARLLCFMFRLAPTEFFGVVRSLRRGWIHLRTDP